MSMHALVNGPIWSFILGRKTSAGVVKPQRRKHACNLGTCKEMPPLIMGSSNGLRYGFVNILPKNCARNS